MKFYLCVGNDPELNYRIMQMRGVELIRKTKKRGFDEWVYEVEESCIEKINEFMWKNRIIDASDYLAPSKRFNPELYINKALKKALEEYVTVTGEKVVVNSTYRPLGTHIFNRKEWDKVDATDLRGHWTGYALDVDISSVDVKELERVGFTRPFRDEAWHFRYIL